MATREQGSKKRQSTLADWCNLRRESTRTDNPLTRFRNERGPAHPACTEHAGQAALAKQREEEAERRRLQRQKERLDTLRKWADRLAKKEVDLTVPLAICDAPTEVLTEAAADPTGPTPAQALALVPLVPDTLLADTLGTPPNLNSEGGPWEV